MGRPRGAAFLISALDAEGVNIGPLVEAAGERHGVPARGLLACLKAESNLNPSAARWGDRTFEAEANLDNPDRLLALVADLELRGLGTDLSFGMGQLTVGTARGYGIGDGSNDLANIFAVRTALFDRGRAIDLAAQHLAGCQAAAQTDYPDAAGDDLIILTLRAYNGGAGYGLTEDYAKHFVAHIASYERALSWANRQVN